jgi:hypothetical protein
LVPFGLGSTVAGLELMQVEGDTESIANHTLRAGNTRFFFKGEVFFK